YRAALTGMQIAEQSSDALAVEMIDQRLCHVRIAGPEGQGTVAADFEDVRSVTVDRNAIGAGDDHLEKGVITQPEHRAASWVSREICHRLAACFIEATRSIRRKSKRGPRQIERAL